MYKIVVVVMVATLYVAPQTTLGQRDTQPEEPASPRGDIQTKSEVIPTSQNTNHKGETIGYTKPLILVRPTNSPTRTSISAGTLSNKIDPSTVMSYGKGVGARSILCSTIARINLNTLTGLPYDYEGFNEGTIARGDAYALALHGAKRGQMIVSTKDSMESDLWLQYEQTRNTIFDVYFYKGSNGGVMQGHRAVVFIGMDDRIYILDPIRGVRGIKPQLLSDHFEADEYRGYTMYISKIGYQPAAQYKTIEEYYQVGQAVPLTQLLQDGIVQAQSSTLLSDTIVLELEQPIKIKSTLGQEVEIEAGAHITVKNTTVMGYDLIYVPLPSSGRLQAVPSSRPLEAKLTGILTTK